MERYEAVHVCSMIYEKNGRTRISRFQGEGRPISEPVAALRESERYVLRILDSDNRKEKVGVLCLRFSLNPDRIGHGTYIVVTMGIVATSLPTTRTSRHCSLRLLHSEMLRM